MSNESSHDFLMKEIMMARGSYHFLSCSINGNDMNDGITLDNWQPKVKNNRLIMSKWRQRQNKGHYNKPGWDEIKKVRMHVKKKKLDADIMKAFGISFEILESIKQNNYNPLERRRIHWQRHEDNE